MLQLPFDSVSLRVIAGWLHLRNARIYGVLQGIVGEGYTRVLGAEKLPDDGVFYPAPGASIDSYEMPGYFHAHASGAGLRFGGAAYSHQRILVLNDRLGASVADIAAGLDAAALPVAHAGAGAGRGAGGGSRRLLR